MGESYSQKLKEAVKKGDIEQILSKAFEQIDGLKG